MMIRSCYAKCCETEGSAATRRTCGLGSELSLCTPTLKSMVNLSAGFSQHCCPTNKEKYVTTNWKSLDIGGVEYTIENNAMPEIFRMSLSSEED